MRRTYISAAAFRCADDHSLGGFRSLIPMNSENTAGWQDPVLLLSL